MSIQKSAGFLLIPATLLLGASPAAAHGLGASVKVKKDQVEVKTYYDDGTAARGAKVHVQDAAKKTIAEGKTDREGIFAFPLPKPGRYELIVNAGLGHLTKTDFTIRTSSEADKIGSAIDSNVPSEEEFTAFPWLKIIIGVTIIGGLCLALLIAVVTGRSRNQNSSPAAPENPDIS